jgi:hypothetical protein
MTSWRPTPEVVAVFSVQGAAKFQLAFVLTVYNAFVKVCWYV